VSLPVAVALGTYGARWVATLISFLGLLSLVLGKLEIKSYGAHVPREFVVLAVLLG
jgi:hypothetical protein